MRRPWITPRAVAGESLARAEVAIPVGSGPLAMALVATGAAARLAAGSSATSLGPGLGLSNLRLYAAVRKLPYAFATPYGVSGARGVDSVCGVSTGSPKISDDDAW